MSNITEMIQQTIGLERKKPSNSEVDGVIELITALRVHQIIRTPKYEFPQIDTIGKVVYQSMNKSQQSR
jgi:hypothetical protein